MYWVRAPSYIRTLGCVTSHVFVTGRVGWAAPYIRSKETRQLLIAARRQVVLPGLSMSPSTAAPPSPQEIQRKLSVHSTAKSKKVGYQTTVSPLRYLVLIWGIAESTDRAGTCIWNRVRFRFRRVTRSSVSHTITIGGFHRSAAVWQQLAATPYLDRRACIGQRRGV